MKKIYIYGASGHGLVVADIAKSSGYTDIVFVDDEKKEYLSFEEIQNNNHIPIAFGIGDNNIRAKLFEKVQRNKFKIVSLIHSSAIISPSAIIDKGTVVMPNVIVNAHAHIGQGVILNSGCIIEHESCIGNFVHISPHVAVAGNVHIGNNTHIGIGSQIIQNIEIGNNCIIGSGSNVVKNIGNYKKAYGNPCREVKDINE